MNTHLVWSSLSTSVLTLAAHPLRTALSTLGIVLGVASLVAVLSVADGVERFSRVQLSQGTDLHAITIAPRTTRTIDGIVLPNPGYPVFTQADLESLKAAVPELATVALLVSGPGVVTSERLPQPRAAMVMASIGAPERRMSAGRYLAPEERAADRAVAVISHNLAAAMAGERSALGERLVIGGRSVEVVGVMAPTADRLFLIDVPYGLVPLVTDTAASGARAPSLAGTAAELEEVAVARRGIERWLAGRVPDWPRQVAIEQNQRRLEQATQAMAVFKLFMGSIVSISLLVGGLGVMNVLLASVTERTREIGIRRAAGARRRDVLWQFLAESVAVTTVGCAIGVLVGIGGANAIAAIMRSRTEAQVSAVLEWPTVLVAFGAAALTGLGFGVYPALKAARISPIDAIRQE
jgi:putative ABC transport system permease protein